jgi:hypothetical protein
LGRSKYPPAKPADIYFASVIMLGAKSIPMILAPRWLPRRQARQYHTRCPKYERRMLLWAYLAKRKRIYDGMRMAGVPEG